MQRDGFFGDARRVADKIERFDQLVAAQHVLPAKTIGIGALLNFVAGEDWWRRCRRRIAFSLDESAEPMLETKSCSMRRKHMEPSAKRDALDAAHLFVGGEQQVDLALDGNAETDL